MHDTLEKVTRENLDDKTAIEYYLQSIQDYDTTAEVQKLLREKGAESLEKSLEKFGNIIKNGVAEIDFSTENIVVDGVPLTGKIDNFVVDEKLQTIEIYDYKTGAFRDGKWDSEPSMFDHMLQLEFYRLLLNGSRKYAKYKVTKGHILYIKADSDGEVHEKVYDYNDSIKFLNRGKVEYELDFRDLAKNVYEHAISLDFIDDPELFIEADKNRNMRQLKDFIKLLLAKSSEK